MPLIVTAEAPAVAVWPAMAMDVPPAVAAVMVGYVGFCVANVPFVWLGRAKEISLQ